MDAVLGRTVGADRLREDLDFRLDARNAIEIAAALDGSEEIRVPAVHRELSTARVLVMQWLDGVSARDLDRINATALTMRLRRPELDCPVPELWRRLSACGAAVTS